WRCGCVKLDANFFAVFHGYLNHVILSLFLLAVCAATALSLARQCSCGAAVSGAQLRAATDGVYN
ncbi:MAG: hypothetical protein RR825_02800, partial [Ruthenibacterium sp.]